MLFREKNMEIEMNNKQVNEKLEDYGNKDEDEEGIDQMMKEL